MAKFVRIYWWTPFVMILSLACGVLFAFGHHLFYNSLRNKPTSTGDYTFMGTHHPGQQFNIALGTAFAFLVKAAYGIALSTAYYQVFWMVVKQDSKAKNRRTLERLDTAFSGISSVISLLDAPTWYRYPLLFFIAATIWLIPIASIITPATLSVDLSENIAHTTMQQVPRIDFSNLNFLAGMPSDGGGTYNYNGPSQIAKQIAMGVASQNVILPITSRFPNASWELDFSGPSLKCDPVSSSESLSFQENIAQYIQHADNCGPPVTYLAWFPRFDMIPNDITNMPYQRESDSNNSTLYFPDPELEFNNNINGTDNEVSKPEATMYIAIMPNMLNLNLSDAQLTPLACDLNDPSLSQITSDNPLGLVGGDVTMLQCRLHNATYRTKFDYLNGAQSVSIDLVKQEMNTTLPITVSAGNFSLGNWGAWAVQCAARNLTSFFGDLAAGDKCGFDEDLFPRLSYTGILQAFANLIDGDVALEPTTKQFLGSARIRSTSLLNTKELYYLTDYAFHTNTSGMGSDFQKSLSQSNLSEISGLSRLQQAPPDQSLQEAIEKMFQNFTVSFMSSSALQPNYSSPNAPPKIPVTQFTAQTIYSYAPKKLWAAYGAATLFTFGSVIIGFLIILMNDASYDNSFSTVLRVSRAAELSVEVQDVDLSGKSPLPPYLAKATVTISSRDQAQTSPTPKSSPSNNDVNSQTTLLP